MPLLSPFLVKWHCAGTPQGPDFVCCRKPLAEQEWAGSLCTGQAPAGQHSMLGRALSSAGEMAPALPWAQLGTSPAVGSARSQSVVQQVAASQPGCPIDRRPSSSAPSSLLCHNCIYLSRLRSSEMSLSSEEGCPSPAFLPGPFLCSALAITPHR